MAYLQINQNEPPTLGRDSVFRLPQLDAARPALSMCSRCVGADDCQLRKRLRAVMTGDRVAVTSCLEFVGR